MKQLLVIDDSRGVRTFLERHLSHIFQLELVEHGDRGLELALQQPYDLVLSDVNLPGLNGFDLYSTLKQARPNQKMVLMTDADIDSYLPQALQAKVENIIAKAAFKYDLDGMIRLLRDLEQPALCGMERRLGPGGEVRTFVLTSEQEVPEILTRCQSILDRFPRRDVYRRLLPELIRNAFVHGGVWTTGNGCDCIHLSIGADWQRVGFGVCDPGGHLTYQSTLEAFIAGRNPLKPLGRSGHGLLVSRKLMDQTFINLRAGALTEILCFDLLQGYRGAHSLHVNVLHG